MRKNIILIGGIFSCLTAQAKPMIKVAVIDTGIISGMPHLCDKGHKDFTNTSLIAENTHGPNVSGLIDDQVKSNAYCQIILKFWDEKSEVSGSHTSILALKEAISQRVDFINYSAGGKGFNVVEFALIEQALDMGITIVAAAGNDGKNLDEKCDFYPACYDERIVVVGNLNEDGSRNSTSNYGSKVNQFVIGTNRCANSICLSGTSQAAAIVTGTLVSRKLSSNKKSR
jgi:subtilisin family serine protease